MQNGSVRVFVKGGPDIVMEYCTKQLNSKGEVIALKDNDRSDMADVVKKYAQMAYRTLLVAYVDYSESDWL